MKLKLIIIAVLLPLYAQASIQYAGGTLINRVFSPVTRADWVGNVTQALCDAGWTTISGSCGSTSAGVDVTLETAAANNGQKIRFRFFDPGSGNCAQTTMKNPAATLTSTIVYSLPGAGSGQWRIIANKFTFFAFVTGNGNTAAQRGICMGGTLYNFSMSSNDNVSLGWMQGNGLSDTDTTAGLTFRVHLRRENTTAPRFSGINGSNLVDQNSGTAGQASIPNWQGGLNTDDSGYRWEDNTLPVYEPLLSWATGTSGGNESKIKGQIYGAAVLNGTWSGESLVSLDSHVWMVITNGPTASTAQTAVLIVAVQ